MGARTSRSGKIKVHVASKSTVALYVVLGVLAAITVFALVVMDYGKVSFPAAMAAAVDDFVTMMTQPGLGGHFTLPDVIEGLFVSLALALLTTFIGAVIAFVLGLLAAYGIVVLIVLSVPFLSGRLFFSWCSLSRRETVGRSGCLRAWECLDWPLSFLFLLGAIPWGGILLYWALYFLWIWLIWLVVAQIKKSVGRWREKQERARR